MQRVTTKTGAQSIQLHGSVEDPTPFEGVAALAHHYEVKDFRLQAFNARFEGGASKNLEPLAFQDQAKVP